MICDNCKQSKPIEEFHRALNEPWGLNGYCDVCWKVKRNEAWTIYRKARREGLISPTNKCEDCFIDGDGEKNKLEGHHLNYHFALFVVWVCPNCHKKRHVKYKSEVAFAHANNLQIPMYYPASAQGRRR